MAATRLKTALVVGCSGDVWKEVEAAKALTTFDAVYCVKLAGVHWQGGRFTWCGLHPEWMEDYAAERAALGLHMDFETVSPPDGELGTAGKSKKIDRRVSYRYPTMEGPSASSGGYAAKVALDDGFDRVVLAGVPMDAASSHFTRGKPWLQRDSFTIGFQKSVPHFAGRVRSMSGWSRELLGEPTRGWLNGEPEQAPQERQVLSQDGSGASTGLAPRQDGQDGAEHSADDATPARGQDGRGEFRDIA